MAGTQIEFSKNLIVTGQREFKNIYCERSSETYKTYLEHQGELKKNVMVRSHEEAYKD
jgi:hypothetical protein